jgi:hypothetical protein
MRRPSCFLAAVAFLAMAPGADAQPLHQRIDALISAKPNFAAMAAPLAGDAEFLRRVTLDLTGTIPTAVEARAFLADPSADKRAKLIDRLLASPEHARHMAAVFDRMLMERRADQHVPRTQWEDYLRAAFAANRPWDELVREVLAADGTDPKLRAAAKFSLDRNGDPNLLTRDIARLFLGMNLHCAQCHDHPLVDDYKQDHYQGVFAFLNRSYVFKTGKKGESVIAEKAEGEVSYQSVFDPSKATKTTPPRMPGRPAVAEPKLEKGKEWLVAPAKDVRPVPKFSRRAQLAGQVTDVANERFRRNAVNRLWALMMGRGIVHPLDLDHGRNPPSHPELLKLLADEFAASKFDTRALLRELALTQTYQRGSELPAGVKEVPPESFAVAILKPLSPEQLARSLMQGSGLTDSERLTLGKTLDETKLSARLAPNIRAFVQTFGSQPGQPEDRGFDVTIDQTLFLNNGSTVRTWLAQRAGNLTDRLMALKDDKAVVDELYLSVLTRAPSEEERKEFVDYLKGRSDRAAAFQELEWALLASAEFRFNH